MRYNYTIVYVPGKQLVLADCLSRCPVGAYAETKNNLPEEITSYVRLTLDSLPATKSRLDQIREAQEMDFICKTLTAYCLTTWPPKGKLPDGLWPYY